MNKIEYREGYEYQLTSHWSGTVAVKPPELVKNDFIILYPDGYLIIRTGYAWDGPSGLALDTPSFMRASLIHDALYQLMREKLIDVHKWRQVADDEMRRICKEDGMSDFRAWYTYHAVRLGGFNAANDPSPTLTAP